MPWARTAALLVEMCVNDLLSAKLVDAVRSMWHCDCGILRTKGNRQNGDDVPSFVLARSQAEYYQQLVCCTRFACSKKLKAAKKHLA